VLERTTWSEDRHQDDRPAQVARGDHPRPGDPWPRCALRSCGARGCGGFVLTLAADGSLAWSPSRSRHRDWGRARDRHWNWNCDGNRDLGRIRHRFDRRRRRRAGCRRCPVSGRRRAGASSSWRADDRRLGQALRLVTVLRLARVRADRAEDPFEQRNAKQEQQQERLFASHDCGPVTVAASESAASGRCRRPDPQSPRASSSPPGCSACGSNP